MAARIKTETRLQLLGLASMRMEMKVRSWLGHCSIATMLLMLPNLTSAAGTWRKSLEGLDLDASQPGFEAYYDRKLDITWLANVGAVQGSQYAWTNERDNNFSAPLATFDNAKAWVSGLAVGQVRGWRLPKPFEIRSMFFKTLGNRDNLLTERGPFQNFAEYRPYNDWIGIYLWSSQVHDSIVTTFGMDGTGWNTALAGNPMIAWAVHDGRPAALMLGARLNSSKH